MSKPISQLLGLITEAAATLDKTCTANGMDLPDLTVPFYAESEAFRQDPIVAEAANVIGAAALQLAALVMPPHLYMFNLIGGQWNAAALRICLESNVTEILREAGPGGMHVKDISAINGIDEQKLSRCLRLLTVHHVYREVKPDVFANTRISSLTDSMKPSKTVIADPEHKHDNTNGFPAMSSFLVDEFSKSAAHLWENVTDPKTAKSGDPAAAPLARAVSGGKALWEFYTQPEQAFRQRRFDIGMRGVFSMIDSNIILQAFDWESLPTNALVVDVGGGVGSVSMALARQCPDLRIVVQDRPSVVENGIQLWEHEMPAALSSGHVKFEAHDFFTPQPQTDATVFFLKHILHDWSDEYSLKILKRLRDVAKPDTRFICMEVIIPYACRVSGDHEVGGIPGAAPAQAPEPLLPNWGLVKAMPFHSDLIMMLACNSLERTIGQFDELFRSAGWKIVNVRRGHRQSMDLAAIEAVPI